MKPQEALERLVAGNLRYVAGEPLATSVTAARRAEVVGGQSPFAVVLGCADSRVPVELVFDQGLGDVFVIRVAGNVVTPSQLGSVEFAVEHLGARLVVVLGHSGCGAVAAAVAGDDSALGEAEHLRGIVAQVRSAVASVAGEGDGDVIDAAVRANVRAGVEALGSESAVLGEAVGSGKVAVVGAVYSMADGVVEWLGA